MLIHPTIQQWQESGHAVGMVEFAPAEVAAGSFPHPVPDRFTAVGMVEAELLCVDQTTGELVLLEHEVANRICCACAATQEHLIAALKILEDYFARCSKSDQYADDPVAGREAIQHASDAAGGSKYAPMYHSLVGY